MGLMQIFQNSKIISGQETEFQVIYKMGMISTEFVKLCIKNVFDKILKDILSRAIFDEKEKSIKLFYDNCLKSEAHKGLITLLSNAIVCNGDLFLVYKENIIRKATKQEEEKIKIDYKKTGSSKVGVYISFQEFKIVNVLELYYQILYNILDAANTGIFISKTVLLKIAKLRELVADGDKDGAIIQAKEIVSAIKAGRPALVDKDDLVEKVDYDIEPAMKSYEMIVGIIAGLLGYPLSYINGELVSGLTATGDADEIAVERGHKTYFYSIFKPVVDALLDVECSFRTENWRKIAAAANVIPIIESSLYIPEDRKEEIILSIFE